MAVWKPNAPFLQDTTDCTGYLWMLYTPFQDFTSDTL